MSRARALLVLLATLVFAWLTTPSALAGSPSPSPVHGYSYNSQLSVAQFSDAAGERGPSSTIYDHQNNALPHGVRGATACSGAAAVSRFGAHRASWPHGYDGSVSSTPVTGGDAAAETPGGALHRTIACSAANRVAAKGAERSVAIGRNMADRVIPYAEKNGLDYYKGTPKWVPRNSIERVSPSALEKTDLWFNKRWINGEMRNGSGIFDIGEPPGYLPSPFYNMERQQVSGYGNYVQDFQP